MKLNWTIAKIEEIAEVNPRLGKAGISDDLLVSFVPMPAVGAGDGSINVTNVRPFAEVKKGFTSFKEGDVLFAKITPCMENGKMAIVPRVKNGYAFGSTEFHVLRPKPGIDARYLYYYVSCRRFRGEAEHQMSGAVGQKRVPTQYLRECIIPVAPPNEQTRIVAEIEKQFSRLDEAVANLKRVKANLKRYKAAVLKAAVEGMLTENWRKQHPDVEPADKLLERILAERRKAAVKGKYKVPVGPDTRGLPELPVGWVWTTAVQACDPVVDCHNKTAPYTESGIPLVRTSNIRDGKLSFDGIRYVDQPTYVFWSKRCPPEPGDVLFTREAPMGEAAIIPPGVKLCMGQRIMLMRPSGAILGAYLLLALLSPVIKRLIDFMAVGSGVKHMRVGDVEVLPIPLPPLAEQHQIVAEVERRLSIVAEAEAQVDANLRRADRLRQSILKQAFSGQLVPQDPNDEPASVLLEQMRGQQTAPVKVSREKPSPQRNAKPAVKAEPKDDTPDHASLDSVLNAILDLMQPGRKYARADLADPLGLTTGHWNAAIQELKRRGQVRQIGARRAATYSVSNN